MTLLVPINARVFSQDQEYHLLRRDLNFLVTEGVDHLQWMDGTGNCFGLKDKYCKPCPKEELNSCENNKKQCQLLKKTI